MGLGVPRQTMRLTGTPASPRLITVNSKEDLTQKARQTIDQIIVRDLNLDAFIFKKDSPTCGLERVKVYGASGIPMIEEGRLSDQRQRESFLNQLYIYSKFTRIERSTRILQEFHQTHKLQLMAYDPGKYQLLGRFAANSKKLNIAEVFVKYEELLVNLLNKPLTTKKYVNVFQHMMGYFKKHLETKEKAHLLKLIEDYKRSKIPLISVSTLFQYLVKKHSVQYLENQSILNPYPEEILTGAQI